jgi:acetyl-CoA carboxylase biotin carboxyl carrier protein
MSMARREVQSEITGRVWKIEARPGDRVAVDQAIIILESMKMEIPISAPAAGRVAEVCVTEKDLVEEGQIVAVLDI